jgi:hypothetical protein
MRLHLPERIIMSYPMVAFPLVLLLSLQIPNQLHVPAPVVDLGEVKSGLPVAYSFELINDGPEAVEILETRASCGCVAGKVEPRLIQSGQRGSLVLCMHTLGQAAGPHSWKATVSYRQGTVEREITVGISVRLVTEITVQPASLTLITDGDLSQIVTLTDRRPAPLKVVGVQTSSPGLKARLLDHAKGSVRIEVEIDQAVPGRHDELLTIDTDDPGYRQLQVPVTVLKSAAAVTAIPPRVEIQGQAGMPVSCLVRLRSGADQPIAVSKIEAGHDGLACRWAPGPGPQATVRIQTDSSQDLESTITIHFASPATKTLTIPVVVHRLGK